MVTLLPKPLHRLLIMLLGNHGLHDNHRYGNIQRAYKQFVGVLCLTVCLVVLLEVFFSPPPNHLRLKRPRYIRQAYIYTVNDINTKRLGNAMFLVASLIGIAQINNATPVLPSDVQLLEVFNLQVPLSTNMENTLGGKSAYHEEFGRRGGAYDIATRHLHKLKSNVRLGFYLQSYKYFNDYADEVRASFHFQEHIAAAVRTFYEKDVPKALSSSKLLEVLGDYVKVGVHIRRGDMAESYYINYGYVTAPAEYFHKAMRYFTEKYPHVIFIICGDDIVWAKQTLQNTSDGRIVVFSEGKMAEVDLAILSQCDHMIMSVGSFGWWAAWLANGTTIYYNKWPRPMTQLEYQVEKRDYFPPEWIGLS